MRKVFGPILAAALLAILSCEEPVAPTVCAAPAFDPPPGSYRDPISLVLSSATEGSAIHYTTNAVTPNIHSPLYSGPIAVDASASFLAVATLEGAIDSPLGRAAYRIGWDLETFAGTLGRPGPEDGVGAAAAFLAPNGIASDGTSLWICDESGHTVRRVSIATRAATTFAGSAGTRGSADGTGAGARFDTPRGISTDGTSLYVTDANGVRTIAIATGVVATLPGTAGMGSIVASGGMLYATHGHAIVRIDAATGAFSVFAGSETSSGYRDGDGSSARFGNPSGIAADGQYLYVTEIMNSDVRRIRLSDVSVDTYAGDPRYWGTVDGTGGAARFSSPSAIALDGDALFVINGGAIRRIDTATRAVTTLRFASGSIAVQDTEPIFLGFPVGLARVGTDLFITDNYLHIVRRAF